VADILLLPSELESFGLVALEAMACEVPVIATRVGGIPEVVRDTLDGFLYDVGDVPAMAQGCLTILNDAQLRFTMGNNARERARREYCASKIVQEYENLYSQTIEKTAKHP
jgi:glycosyltransferase involved in cell wall biosynthesis